MKIPCIRSRRNQRKQDIKRQDQQIGVIGETERKWGKCVRPIISDMAEGTAPLILLVWALMISSLHWLRCHMTKYFIGNLVCPKPTMHVAWSVLNTARPQEVLYWKVDSWRNVYSAKASPYFRTMQHCLKCLQLHWHFQKPYPVMLQ